MQTKTLIVGYGITGKNLEKEIAPLYPDLKSIMAFNDKMKYINHPKGNG